MTDWERVYLLDQLAGTHRDNLLDDEERERCPVHGNALIDAYCPECCRESYEGEIMLRRRYKANRGRRSV